jgi:opacity protein-like surface antigen
MGMLKTLALAGAATIVASVTASAADLGPPPMPLPPPPMMAPGIEASGWYLRGDIGVGAIDATKFKYSDNAPGFAFDNKDFQHQVFGGIGVGYQFNSWLRFDVTGEYRGKTGWGIRDSYTGSAFNCSSFYVGAPVGSVFCRPTGSNNIKANISSMVLMANAYLDLGTWNGLTPFVGVGLGMTQNKVTGVSDNGFATNTVSASTFLGAPVGSSATSNTFGTAANGSKSNVAWALMAGVAYDVTPNAKVEFGYRYLNLGKIETGNFSCSGGCAGIYSLGAKTLDSHEFKVGMRWHFGAVGYAPSPAEYPVAEPRMIKKF